MFAGILEIDFKLSQNILVDPPRNAYPPRCGQGLKTRSDVHSFAPNIAFVDNDLPDVDADAKLDSTLLREFRIALRHSALKLNGALHRVHDAGKFDQNSVTRHSN